VVDDPVTVLAVDDQSVNLRLLDAVLSPRGHRVLTASTGADGLALLDAEDIDIVLLDVVMPEMDGYEVCRRIRSNESTEFLPVVMITAFGSIDTAIKAVKLGAYDYITKPFEIEALAIAVDKAVAERGLRKEVARLRKELQRPYRMGNVVGRSPGMQEVFGLAATPRIGGGAVPVTFTLLSPGRKPLQITRDLASFWRNAYLEVRKDMRGRYPRHYWPENPLEAEPTRRVKPRN